MPEQKPWEKYSHPPQEEGPWAKYQTQPEQTAPQPQAPEPQVAKAQVLNIPSSMGNIPITLPPALAGALKKVRDFITPTPRSAARMVGGAIGGALGSPGVLAGPAGVGTIAYGGAMGAAGGDALYQVIQELRGKQTEAQPMEIVKAMGQGALQEGLVPFIQGPLAGATERNIVNTIGRVSKPATEGEKAVIRSVAPDIANDFPVAGSTGGLLDAYKGKLADAGRELDSAYRSIPSTFKLKSAPMKAAVIAEKAKLFVQGEVPPGSEAQAKAFDEVINWFDRHPTFTVDELRQNKSLWDGVVNWYRGSLSTEPAKEQAYATGANMIRGTLNQLFPRIAEGNQKVHAWKAVTDSLGRADVKSYGKATSYLPGAIKGGLGALAGGAIGGFQGAAIGGVGAAAANELINSTAFQTASIPIQTAALKLIQNGNVQAAIHLLSAIGAAGALKPNERVPMSVQNQ